MTSGSGARAAIAAVQEHEAWALIRRSTRAGDRDTIGIVGGVRWEAESLLDIPLEQGPPTRGRLCDRLVAVPFRQVGERGFDAHDDGTPLVVVDVETEQEFSVADVVTAIDPVEVDFLDRGGFETPDDEYAKVVEAIIADEIGQGEGANLVVGRHYRAVAADWSATKALAVFRRLLERERGAYWTFCFFTGDRYLIGASPERHVSVHGGDVRMNPISGTFRVRGEVSTGSTTEGTGSTTEGAGSTTEGTGSTTEGTGSTIEGAGSTTEGAGSTTDTLKPRLMEFLADEKEIYELFMVVDEELKMMCEICHEGGQVLGPFLKPMTHLIHTEYLLAGRTHRDVREVLRDTMYAATVTGSPVENACRLIKVYESEGRGYYGAALALFGRDDAGEPTVDSPILIRTADISPDGHLKVTAGATLVRDSDAAYEVAETHAKAGGILSAFGLVPAAPAPPADIAALASDEDVLIALNSRNARLSRFWLTDQAGAPPDPRLAGKRVLVLDGEDDFVNMLRHVLGVFGMTCSVLRHERIESGLLDEFGDYDLVIVGPGPGDPRDGDDPKIARFRAAVQRLLDNEQPFLAVCLGHQTLCHALGIPLHFKDIVFQGTQSPVQIDDRTERVGFYNTFVGRVGLDTLAALPARPAGGVVSIEADPDTGDIHVVRGDNFRGIQFHAESILTEHGYDLLHQLVRDLIGDRPPVRGRV